MAENTNELNPRVWFVPRSGCEIIRQIYVLHGIEPTSNIDFYIDSSDKMVGGTSVYEGEKDVGNGGELITRRTIGQRHLVFLSPFLYNHLHNSQVTITGAGFFVTAAPILMFCLLTVWDEITQCDVDNFSNVDAQIRVLSKMQTMSLYGLERELTQQLGGDCSLAGTVRDAIESRIVN